MPEIKSLIYPVKDISHAKTIYSTLFGIAPYTDSPYYVGFKVGNKDVGLDPNGHHNGMTAPVSFVQVQDIHSTLQALLENGALVHQEVKDVGAGTLTALFKDLDGNITGLIQGA